MPTTYQTATQKHYGFIQSPLKVPAVSCACHSLASNQQQGNRHWIQKAARCKCRAMAYYLFLVRRYAGQACKWNFGYACIRLPEIESSVDATPCLQRLQQALDEMCKMLDDNKSRKYKNRGRKKMTKIFAFGAASFSSSLKANKAAPTRSFKAALKSYAFTNNHYFIEVDEYLTSQICSICQTRTLENLEFKEKKEKIYAVLKCINCCQVFNRDINASINIRVVFIYIALNDDSKTQIFQED